MHGKRRLAAQKRREEAERIKNGGAPRKIRAPGEDRELTDEEIMAIDSKFLNADERRRRRNILNRGEKARSSARRRERLEKGISKEVFCHGTTRAGEPCAAYAVGGAMHCMGHLTPEEEEKLGIKKLGYYGHMKRGRNPKMNGPQMATQIFEQGLEAIFRRYFSPLGIEFAGFDAENKPVLIDHGPEAGLRLSGTDKDGNVVMSDHPDALNQVNVTEKLWDRIYGKPRQTQVIEGGKQAVKIQPVRAEDRARAVAEILASSGALPRPAVEHPEEEQVESSVEPSIGDGSSRTPDGSVIPLRPREGS